MQGRRGFQFRPVFDDAPTIGALFSPQVREQSARVIIKTVTKRFAGGAHVGLGFIRMDFHGITVCSRRTGYHELCAQINSS